MPPLLTVRVAAPQYYTPSQAAVVAGVTVRTIYAMVKAGHLPARHFGTTGRLVRIPRRAVDPAASGR